jgi:hypothetical protein
MTAVVVGLGLVGCGEPNPLPAVSAPARTIPSPTEQLDSALGTDPRCRPTTGGDFAHRSYASPLSVESAEVILVCTTRFEFGGMPPKRQAQAFNVVFEQADAVARFQSIAAKAGPAGRLYAFAALQILAKSDADTLAADLARDTRAVLVQDSDVIVGPRPASAVVDLVRSKRIGDDFRRERDAIAAHYNKAG